MRVTRTIGTALLSATVLAAACGENEANAGTEEVAPAITIGAENIAVVSSETIATGPGLSGSLSAELEATVRAQVAGPVMSTHADQGSRVAAGTLLARVDDRTMRDAFLSARGGVATAQSAANMAAREVERFTKLRDAGAVSDREFETVKWNGEAAQSQLADAQARLTLAQKQLDDAQLRAPFAGVVSVRQVNAGDVVSPGTAMFTIIDPSSMRLEASVPASHLGAIKVGAPVSFAVSGYAGRTFAGRISRINPAADASTGQVRVVVSIPNAGGNLVAGLFAEGRVASERRTGLTAPASAVDATGLRPSVLRLRGGVAERVEVQLGLRDEETERVEITGGVAAGDTLLAGAAQGISAGTRVTVNVTGDVAPARN